MVCVPGGNLRTLILIAAAEALAWIGMVIHNLADLPGLTLSSGENVWPGAVWLLLFALLVLVPRSPWPATLLFSWGLLNLVGGALSVLPLPFLPYHPEQTLPHYFFHVLYAGAQLPLLVVSRREQRRRHLKERI